MWICPTHNRPERLATLVASLGRVTTPGIVVINGRQRLGEYLDIELPASWAYRILPENIGYCAAYNLIFGERPNEPFYGWLSDDEVMLTEGWDAKLAEAAGRAYLAHSDDGWQSRRRISGTVAIGGDLVRAIGYIFIPGLWHQYSEAMWERLAERCDIRRFCPDVRTENNHYLAGKAAKDATYREGEKHVGRDRSVYMGWVYRELPEIHARIKQPLKGVNHG